MSEPSSLDRIEQICSAFEAAWKTGDPPQVANYVDTEIPREVRGELLVELISIDLAYRWQTNDSPESFLVEKYFAEFPALTVAQQQELIIEEYRCRRRCGEQPHESLLARFPDRREALATEFARLEAAEAAPEMADDVAPREDKRPSGKLTCPHCLRSLSVHLEQVAEPIECPHCHERFTVADPEFLPAAGGSIAHFQLRRQVGIGAFGTVWEAVDTQLDRVVAIKVPRTGGLSGDDSERIFREARAAAQLRHPHIVPVYEAGIDERVAYIVSEFQEGETLSERLKQGPCSIRDAARLCAQLAEALEHAHDRGVVHRDLKPGNIMLDAAGEPHITDFGLAGRTSDAMTVTLEGKLLGTPAYMSPEQASGRSHQADHRSDVYALGVILYELICGQVPFYGDLRAVLNQVINEPPPPLRSRNRHVDRDLETICMKCLEKTPSHRYASAAALADDLGRYLRGEPIAARPVSAATRGMRWIRRNPLAATIVALVLLFTSAGSGLLVRQWNLSRVLSAEAGEKAAARRLAESRTALLRNETVARAAAESQAESERKAKQAAELLASVRRQQNYRAQLQLAVQANQLGSLALASSALDQCPEELRDWEWRHLDWYRPRSLLTLSSGGRIFGLGYSQDGCQLVSAGDGRVILWSVNSGEPVWSVTHAGATTVAMHPIQPLVADSGHDGVLVVRSSTDGRLIQSIKARGEANWAMQFHPQGKYLATGGSNSRVTVWDTESWRKTSMVVPHLETVRGVAWSADGRWLTSISQAGDWKMLDMETGVVETLSEAGISGGESVAFHPLGKSVLRGNSDGSIFSLDLSQRRLTRVEAPVTYRVSGLGCLTSGAIVSGGRDGSVVLHKKSAPLEIESGTKRVFALATSPTQEQFAVGGLNHSICIWSAEVPQPLVFHATSKRAADVAVHPNQPWVAVGTEDGTVELWDYQVGRQLDTWWDHAAPISAVDFSSDGTHLATAGVDGNTSVRNLDTEKSYRILGPSPFGAQIVRFSPDGQLLAVAGKQNESPAMQIWDLRREEMMETFASLPDTVSACAFDPTGSKLGFTLSTQPGQAFIWDWQCGLPSKLPEAFSDTRDIAFSHDGDRLYFARGDQRMVSCWHVTAQETLHEYLGTEGRIANLALSPTSHRLFAVDRTGELAVWDTIDQSLLWTIRGHDRAVSAVALSPDGQTLITAADDGSIRVWETVHPTSEIRQQRALHAEARRLVDRLAEQLPLAAQQLKAIERDDTLEASLKERAQTVVRARGNSPGALRSQCWEVARLADRSNADYERGLMLIEVLRQDGPQTRRDALLHALLLRRLGRMVESDALRQHADDMLVNDSGWQSDQTKRFTHQILAAF